MICVHSIHLHILLVKLSEDVIVIFVSIMVIHHITRDFGFLLGQQQQKLYISKQIQYFMVTKDNNLY